MPKTKPKKRKPQPLNRRDTEELLYQDPALKDLMASARRHVLIEYRALRLLSALGFDTKVKTAAVAMELHDLRSTSSLTRMRR